MAGTFRDPGDALRARPHHRNRIQYAWREFLTTMGIVRAWLVLAVAVIIVDRTAESVRQAFAVVVSPQAASMLLSTVTPGLLTVVSIIFFVLIMAVQAPIHHLQPRGAGPVPTPSNQLFFGMFVGLTMYCLLALG